MGGYTGEKVQEKNEQEAQMMIKEAEKKQRSKPDLAWRISGDGVAVVQVDKAPVADPGANNSAPNFSVPDSLSA
ncbi:hypothetical protein BT63DRAFT_459503 [Microthyrium microscopicum]|uniref:Uncharacterized protein n=1 Tax=Microthyrium microscopicum TaxID=703497 RepID=A0A6A6TZP3_9PEZI|nr:hypothetical protein BT63DRAFT_459503 [Microthyrium microscopicum]